MLLTDVQMLIDSGGVSRVGWSLGLAAELCTVTFRTRLYV
jgi:hypothetical protein